MSDREASVIIGACVDTVNPDLTPHSESWYLDIRSGYFGAHVHAGPEYLESLNIQTEEQAQQHFEKRASEIMGNVLVGGTIDGLHVTPQDMDSVRSRMVVASDPQRPADVQITNVAITLIEDGSEE